MTEEVTPQPLSPPDPHLIQKLFDEDPLKLSDQDIDTIIASFRADRLSYLQPKEEKTAAKKAAAKKAASAADQAAAADLLADLGL